MHVNDGFGQDDVDAEGLVSLYLNAFAITTITVFVADNAFGPQLKQAHAHSPLRYYIVIMFMCVHMATTIRVCTCGVSNGVW